MAVKSKHGIEFTLDAALIAMLEEQCNDLEVDAIIEMFRPPARYIQAPIVIENKVYDTMSYEKGVPLHATKPAVFREEQQKIYTATKEVPVYIEKPVELEVTRQVPVEITTQKVHTVSVPEERIVERIVEVSKEVPVEIEKIVSMMEREEVIKQIEVDKVIKDTEIR